LCRRIQLLSTYIVTAYVDVDTVSLIKNLLTYAKMPIFRSWEDSSILHVRCIQPIYIGKNIYWAGLPYFFPITTDYIYWQRSDAWINSGEGNMQVAKLMEFGQWRKHIYLSIKKGELRNSFSIYSLCQSNKTPLNNELVIV
jgi:hypothetical protein